MDKNTWYDVDEKDRTYIYPDSDSALSFKNVTRLRVSESHFHYLEYGDAKKAIVAPGWVAVVIDADEWTEELQ